MFAMSMLHVIISIVQDYVFVSFYFACKRWRQFLKSGSIQWLLLLFCIECIEAFSNEVYWITSTVSKPIEN